MQFLTFCYFPHFRSWSSSQCFALKHCQSVYFPQRDRTSLITKTVFLFVWYCNWEYKISICCLVLVNSSFSLITYQFHDKYVYTYKHYVLLTDDMTSTFIHRNITYISIWNSMKGLAAISRSWTNLQQKDSVLLQIALLFRYYQYL